MMELHTGHLVTSTKFEATHLREFLAHYDSSHSSDGAVIPAHTTPYFHAFEMSARCEHGVKAVIGGLAAVQSFEPLQYLRSKCFCMFVVFLTVHLVKCSCVLCFC